MPKYDLCIIGGGPAGMMAGIMAAKNGKKVILLEKNKELGSKLLLTGGGRCNLTHTNLTNREFALKFGKQGDFLLSPLSSFGVKETMDFFSENGLDLKIEDNKVYPKSEKSKDVLSFFRKELNKYDVKIILNREVSNFILEDKIIKSIVLKNSSEISAQNYLISTGGKSYPMTGSTGDGYLFAQKMGHTITELKPALTPIEIKEKWVSLLKGLTLYNAGIKLNNEKQIIGDVLFTHFGISGPIILNLSERIKSKDKIYLDLFPLKNIEELEKNIVNSIEENYKKTIYNTLEKIIPSKLLLIILNFSDIQKETICRNITKEGRRKLINNLKKIELNVVGLLGFEKAMVTKGGVSLKEIDSKTMKSKIIHNLYFAGEVIDLNGETGGFNLQMCFTTGAVMGQNIDN
ncbi:MAG: NAD(P)/FAD-dependent oxidoreductase [Candidatus Pacebacteria bacterium]|nr:NAD(P)/FAD-dependent oxidoreductase [Candidatus Paceibacterota bacterium]